MLPIEYTTAPIPHLYFHYAAISLCGLIDFRALLGVFLLLWGLHFALAIAQCISISRAIQHSYGTELFGTPAGTALSRSTVDYPVLDNIPTRSFPIRSKPVESSLPPATRLGLADKVIPDPSQAEAVTPETV